MSLWEWFCPVCEAELHEWPFVAPTDYYRCWQCLEATPFHELPRRNTLHKWTGPIPEPSTLVNPHSRFYFCADSGVVGDTSFLSPVSPLLAAWDDTTQTAYRPGNPWRMQTNKDSALSFQRGEAFSATIGVANHKTLLLGQVSDPIEGGTISGTVKGQMRWLQDFADLAQDRVTIALSVVSGDGLITRGYLLPLSFYGTTNLFQVAPNNPQNRFLANGDAMTPVVAEDGDRLFLEVGSQPSNAPTLGDFVACYVGGNIATDLPEDETTSTELSPWIELIP